MKQEWIQTDPSCNQMMKQLDEKKFLFKENRIANPETGEISVYESEIDLDDYDNAKIIDSCLAFGYSEDQVNEWLTNRKELALIAECIFELEI